ncbi:GlxA family transcriptional regulator [Aestuariivita sp.]|uniref:GlxA family transcriptional regulator n=1 Tax=Aestuariivita sp. TaxID=1872407 RepID=UPI0021733004|nr:GlxA family transcriptional regulator [Aestuariivita sp.]MCE8009398.1 GlxA family transcriptional regulator [Aestuariivita sp.]
MKSAQSILTSASATLNVAVLTFQATNTLSFAAAIDPMRAANRQAGRQLFDWTYVTPGSDPVVLTSGITLTGTPLAQLIATDLLIVVAGFRIEEQATPAIGASLRRLAASGATLAGIDGGPWILAASGVLDGETATTHWEDLGAFAIRFPDVTTVANRFCISHARMTCGGAIPAIDMMLHLIAARHGRKLARQVAGAFIHDVATDPARPQTRAGPDPRHNRLTAEASALMEHTLDAPLPIPEIARRLRISPRTLETQFRARLGRSPKAHYLTLRLAEALRLVTQTDHALIDIALATGFGSAASFSRAFRAAHGTSARRLRSG